MTRSAYAAGLTGRPTGANTFARSVAGYTMTTVHRSVNPVIKTFTWKHNSGMPLKERLSPITANYTPPYSSKENAPNPISGYALN
ncbi:hypothetical protein [Dysgonomonas sp. 511]|uniref:hypothetical protein n=1 Tax=Dysgonomonas sp. 511 TaxID=2302930 RepID=UPI0013D77525|nr:hypothetical protein [Dysgonomonas sp. 511]